jgi:hypothetical protein
MGTHVDAAPRAAQKLCASGRKSIAYDRATVGHIEAHLTESIRCGTRAVLATTLALASADRKLKGGESRPQSACERKLYTAPFFRFYRSFERSGPNVSTRALI